MRSGALPGLCAIALAAAAPGTPARAEDNGHGVITALIENDIFGSEDRNYTNGVKFGYLGPYGRNDKFRNWVIKNFWIGQPEPVLRSSWGFGQSMFTPDNITVVTPLPGQRPYAGWLYGFWGLIAEEPNVTSTLDIELGVVGPSAGAKWVQSNFHKLINGAEPKGWDNQLKDEPGIVATIERTWRIAYSTQENGLDFDLSPDLGGSLGNVDTEAFTGATVRMGTDLEETALPMRVRPSLTGSGGFTTTQGWSWSLFAGVYGRAVAHNIFLDGNTFRDSLSVHKKTFVADGQAGLAVRVGPILMSYTYVLRGEEYDGQHGNSRFGAVALSVHL